MKGTLDESCVQELCVHVKEGSTELALYPRLCHMLSFAVAVPWYAIGSHHVAVVVLEDDAPLFLVECIRSLLD